MRFSLLQILIFLLQSEILPASKLNFACYKSHSVTVIPAFKSLEIFKIIQKNRKTVYELGNYQHFLIFHFNNLFFSLFDTILKSSCFYCYSIVNNLRNIVYCDYSIYPFLERVNRLCIFCKKVFFFFL